MLSADVAKAAPPWTADRCACRRCFWRTDFADVFNMYDGLIAGEALGKLKRAWSKHSTKDFFEQVWVAAAAAAAAKAAPLSTESRSATRRFGPFL